MTDAPHRGFLNRERREQRAIMSTTWLLSAISSSILMIVPVNWHCLTVMLQVS